MNYLLLAVFILQCINTLASLVVVWQRQRAIQLARLRELEIEQTWDDIELNDRAGNSQPNKGGGADLSAKDMP